MGNRAKGIKDIPMSGEERGKAGVIASLTRGDEERSVHFPGAGAISRIADYCDKHDWKIRCLSTPQTVYRDLQGTRESVEDTIAGDRRTGLAGQSVELRMLGRIGRIDLVESRDS